MKTTDRIDLDPTAIARRNLTAPMAIASLALAAATIPSIAGDEMGAASKRDPKAIRPFHVHITEATLIDLRRRIVAARWSDKEFVSHQSQGVQLATMREPARYWGTEYDWRKAEAELNALPMFVTTIDGVDIQFIHVRSRHPNALPLIMTHGWSGSIFECLGTIGPLTDPTAYGAHPEDAFDVVIPSMPGYGFSGTPATTGWNSDRIARAWDTLMKRLGYPRYVSQGGDWGARVSESLARQAPPGLHETASDSYRCFGINE